MEQEDRKEREILKGKIKKEKGNRIVIC